MRLTYDFHIHTALSPCGDNDMTPANLAGMAALAGLDAIAVTDHNSCGNCAAVMEAARGRACWCCPVWSCAPPRKLTWSACFPLSRGPWPLKRRCRPTLPPVENRPDIFGEQLLLSAQDEIVGREPLLLTTASGVSVDGVLALARATAAPLSPPISTAPLTA